MSIIYSNQPPATVLEEFVAEVLLIGPWEVGEFGEVLPLLSASKTWKRAINCQMAVEQLADSESTPELILLADPLPCTHAQWDVERLRQAAPLAGLVVVAGSWCEGELRTGAPLEGVVRLYWYELPGWWSAALKAIEMSGCPPWSLPLDAPLAGRSLNRVACGCLTLDATVAIDTKSWATFDTFAIALGAYSATCVWSRRADLRQLPDQLNVGIWDGGQLEPLEVERLQSFVHSIRARNGKVVALLDFPRREHLAMLRDVGCDAVFGKPYMVEELVCRLRSLLSTTQP